MIKRSNTVCQFCDTHTEPSYKDAKVLSRFMTEKGKIVARTRSGVCHKHQALLSSEIKRARQLALLPFVTLVE